MIKVDNLKVSFDSKEVLKGISTTFDAGKSYAILGTSGAGKTVFIKNLSGLMLPTSGTVSIEGKRGYIQSHKNNKDYISNIGFAFQSNALFDSNTNWQNVCFTDYSKLFRNKRAIKKRALECLSQVGINYKSAHLFPSDISGGMQKRVAIARAIYHLPRVIFFDEPTSGLDPVTSAKIAKLIAECDINLKRKVTKFCIIHDISIARQIADEVIFLHQGQIYWRGTPAEMDASSNAELQTFIKG